MDCYMQVRITSLGSPLPLDKLLTQEKKQFEDWNGDPWVYEEYAVITDNFITGCISRWMKDILYHDLDT